MIFEKREFPRTEIDVPALITDGKNHKEINCMVKNISENGICLEVPIDEYKNDLIKVGEGVHVQYIDTYQYGRNIETEVLSTECTVRHIKEIGKKIIMGAYITEDDFRSYAIRREIMSEFLRSRAYA